MEVASRRRRAGVVIASRQFIAVHRYPDEGVEAVSTIIGRGQRNRLAAFRPAASPLKGGVSGGRGSPG